MKRNGIMKIGINSGMKTILKILMLGIFFSANGQTVSNEMVLDTITMFKTEKVSLYRPESAVFSVDCKDVDGCFYNLVDYDNFCLIIIANLFNSYYNFSEDYELYKTIRNGNHVKRDYFCKINDDGAKKYSRRDSYSPSGIDVIYIDVPEGKLEEYDFYLDSVVLMLGRNSYPPSKEKVCEE